MADPCCYMQWSNCYFWLVLQVWFEPDLENWIKYRFDIIMPMHHNLLPQAKILTPDAKMLFAKQSWTKRQKAFNNISFFLNIVECSNLLLIWLQIMAPNEDQNKELFFPSVSSFSPSAVAPCPPSEILYRGICTTTFAVVDQLQANFLLFFFGFPPRVTHNVRWSVSPKELKTTQ